MSVYYSDYGNSYYEHDYHNDMTNPVSTNCSRFERRHDFSTFNMSDYMSCENCRHLSAENRCIASAGHYFGRME